MGATAVELVVSRNYFDTMGVALLEGRDFFEGPPPWSSIVRSLSPLR